MKERKLTRLKGYNYSQSGYYFVTICTKDRGEWFGSIEQESMRSLRNRTKMLLCKIIQQYKASVTRTINSLKNVFHFGRQKSFYDHVIRNDRSLDNLRQYITNNPLKWELDIENRKGNSPHKNCVDYYGEIIGKKKEVGNAYLRSLHR